MKHLVKRFESAFWDKKAATAIEYSLIAGLIAIAAVGAMRGLGENVTNTYDNVSTAYNSVNQ